MTKTIDTDVFRVHGTAMEPSFRDGEYLQVNFGLEADYGSGGVRGYAAEIVVCYRDGKNELVEYFGLPHHPDIVRSGYVVKRLAKGSFRKKVLSIDARHDARWRERHRPTRKIYAT